LSENPIKRELNLAYLGGEVEPQITVGHNTVLDKQGNFAGQAEFDRFGQSTRLAEVCQVFQGEGERDRLSQVDFDVLAGLLHTAVLPQLD
jgi:hypothetical protein